MTEYTYKDVIIDPEDPRVEIGAEYYFGDTPLECIAVANSDSFDGSSMLVDIEEKKERPFARAASTSSGVLWYVCLIRKAEQEKKYIPFDLSDLEVRDKLRGKWIKSNHSPYPEDMITGFYLSEDIWQVNYSYNAEELLNDWEFLDGTPCGELVEDE